MATTSFLGLEGVLGTDKVDAIINVAGGWAGGNAASKGKLCIVCIFVSGLFPNILYKPIPDSCKGLSHNNEFSCALYNLQSDVFVLFNPYGLIYTCICKQQECHLQILQRSV